MADVTQHDDDERKALRAERGWLEAAGLFPCRFSALADGAHLDRLSATLNSWLHEMPHVAASPVQRQREAPGDAVELPCLPIADRS